MPRSPTRNNPARRAFTLLETVLVLSLLVILAALAWPALHQPLAGQRLRGAADQVRAQWARARNRAIVSGEILSFVCVPGTPTYRIAPASQMSTTGVDTQLEMAASSTEAGGQRVPAAAAGFTLPAGVVFVAAGPLADQGDPASFPELQQAGPESPPILFYPDGTATSARAVLQGEDGRQIAVELRGLTGGSRAAAPYLPQGQTP